MNKKKLQTIPRTKDEAIAEAKRYLKNAKGFILPGLGDAGDRIFGTEN
jgi:uracil phosphoribosyltransferase